MAVPDREEGKRREVVGVVVDDRRVREMEVAIKEKVKREALELELETEKGEEVVMVVEKGQEKEQEEESRVSICIPPRNALLLMRCRSDPVRMAALASRFWDSPAMQVRVEEEEGEEKEDGGDENRDQCLERNEKVEGEARNEEAAETDQSHQEAEEVEESHQRVILTEELTKECDRAKEEELQLSPDQEKQNKDEDLIKATAAEPVEAIGNAEMDQEEQEVAVDEAEKLQLEEKPGEKEMMGETHLEDREDDKEVEKGRRSSSYSSAIDKEERRSNRHTWRSKEGGRRRSSASRERDRRRHSFSTEREVGRPSSGSEKELRRASFSIEGKGRWSFSIEKDGLKLEKEEIDEEKKSKGECSAEEENGSKDNIEIQNSHSTEKEGKEEVFGDREQYQVEWEAREKRDEEKKCTELPDCLLLMMYEPKLSMEVSKETWVCSNDFLRWRLHHPNYRPRHPSKSTAAAAVPATANTSGTDVGGTKVDEVTKEVSKVNIADKGSEIKEAVALAQEPAQPALLPPPTVPPTALDTEKKPRGSAAVLPTPAPAPSYGPFVLTRCKSEPMRSSARLAPDACFWKDRHRPIGATGIGF